MHLRHIGGLAALVVAATSILGLVVNETMLRPGGYGGATPDILTMLTASENALYLRYMVEYVLRGLVFVILAVALDARLRGASPDLARVAFAFGGIWVTLLIISGLLASIMPALVLEQATVNREYAIDLYTSLMAILSRLAVGDVILGGLWLALTSYGALRAGVARPICYFGMAVGVAGLCPLVPTLTAPGSTLFTLGSIAWFVGIGVDLLWRDPAAASASRLDLQHGPAGFSPPRMTLE